MNRNRKYKVIQLNGLSGFVLALVLIFTVVASVVVMPVYGVKFLWNEILSASFGISTIRLAQAALLWFAALAVAYGYLKSRIQFKFINQADLPDSTLRQIDYEKFMEQIKKEQQNDEKINR